MKLSRASGYAVLAVMAIARKQREDPGGSVQIKSIAAEYNLPHDYIAKLLTMMVKTRILKSDRGRDGGFTLRRRASEISILEVVEAVDGPMESDDLLGRVGGHETIHQNVEAMLDGALDTLKTILKERSVESLLD